MFKKIPGNDSYIIALNSQIRKLNGDYCNVPLNNGKITLNLYGEEKTVTLNWLSLIAHFEINLPDHLGKIKFKEINPLLTRSNCGLLTVFDSPIIFKEGFRVIPNYTDYAISEDGVVIDIRDNKEITVKHTVNKYPTVLIYDPDKGFYKNVLVHRLVALAWLENDDYFGKPIVNHIDGNKENFHASNLEWCSYSHNSRHAFKIGLNGSPKKYKVRDIYSSEVKTFESFRDLCEEIGLPRGTKFHDKDSRKRSKLVKERFEIKELNDNTPWLSKEEALIKKNRYTITIFHTDGGIEEFHAITDVMRRLKIWNISYNVRKIVEVAKTKFPDMRIEVIDNYACGEVEALNVETSEVTAAKSIKELSRKLNIGYSTIHRAVNSPSKYICKGYVFRYKTEEPWENNYRHHPNSPKPIRVKNLKTGVVLDFLTKFDAAAAFKTTVSNIRYRSENKSTIGDWEFSVVRANDKVCASKQ